MHILILFLFFAIQALLLLTSARQMDLIDADIAQTRNAAVKQVAAAVSNYYIETGAYPASVTALAATPGYEYLQSANLFFQNIATTTGLNDGVWIYNRVAVYTQDAYSPLTDATYLSAAQNTCGSGDFATGSDWCGNKNSLWWKHETRETITADITRERNRQRRLLNKFNAWYNGDTSVSTVNGIWGNNYPNPGAAAASLTTLVAGFSQTAATCTGIYTWHGIPLDCTDFYSVWGTPTVYNYLSSSHIVLLTQTPYTKADGTVLYVSTEESL